MVTRRRNEPPAPEPFVIFSLVSEDEFKHLAQPSLVIGGARSPRFIRSATAMGSSDRSSAWLRLARPPSPETATTQPAVSWPALRFRSLGSAGSPIQSEARTTSTTRSRVGSGASPMQAPLLRCCRLLSAAVEEATGVGFYFATSVPLMGTRLQREHQRLAWAIPSEEDWPGAHPPGRPPPHRKETERRPRRRLGYRTPEECFLGSS